MSSAEKVKSQIDLVEKVTQRIITLCSAIIVVLVTILGYYFEYSANRSSPSMWTWPILAAGVSFLLSIFLGLLVYGSLINSLYRAKKLEEVDVYVRVVKWCAIFQWFTFATGIAFLVVTLYQISLMPL